MSRAGRVGVVVLDHGRPADAERAAASARDAALAPRILIVANGSPGVDVPGTETLELPTNLGFGGGMNAGLERLRAAGCDRFLLLNNDAVLEPGCLRLLAEALDDPVLAAVGPVILRASDRRVESAGVRVRLGAGRVRLQGHGRRLEGFLASTDPDALSGAVIMLSRAAVDRLGLLDAEYFFGFEDVDWCLRARRAGFSVAVVHPAFAQHGGSTTIGRRSPDRLYYGTRNHIRCIESHRPLSGIATGARRALILALNLALAIRQRDVSRGAAIRAVRQGFGDARRGLYGRRAPDAAAFEDHSCEESTDPHGSQIRPSNPSG